MPLSTQQEANLKAKIAQVWQQAEDQTGPLASKFAQELQKNEGAVNVLVKTGKIPAEMAPKESLRRTTENSLKTLQDEYVLAVNNMENGAPAPPNLGVMGNQALSMGQSFLSNIPFIGPLLGLFGLDKLLPIAIKAMTVGYEYFSQSSTGNAKKSFGDVWAENGKKTALAQVAQNLGFKADNFTAEVMSDKPVAVAANPASSSVSSNAPPGMQVPPQAVAGTGTPSAAPQQR